ncbi:PqqD family protein [Candidatus Sumerlaeota bacterium]|nr:PqqD family protein [Candidatus Sumerlaeota bacterium]
MSGDKNNTISRSRAMQGRPEQLPAVKREEREDGGVLVTVEIPRTGVLKLVLGVGTVERTFGLDRFGREIYEACDGKRTVQAVCDQFSKKHQVTQGEAEQAVSTYLKTLVSKSLVAIAIERR